LRKSTIWDILGLDIQHSIGYITYMKINYDELDEMYEGIPTKQSLRPSVSPVGSLTDNRRKVKPNRDGAHKRMMEWQKEY
jgi:hypothetical protein